MNRIQQALIIGEEIADKFGVVERWRSAYLHYRQSHSITQSLQLSLQDQCLWDQFVARCTPQFLHDYYGVEA